MNKRYSKEELQVALSGMGERAVMASRRLATMSTHEKNNCLLAIADALEHEKDTLKRANHKDLEAARQKGITSAMLDRLELNDKRIAAMATGLREVAALEDPVGRPLADWVRPNGLEIKKISVPIGVIAIVYEARPNVTIDAAGLCLKSGNAVILRGGSEAINSNLALAHCATRACLSCGLDEGAIQVVPMTDREAVSVLLKMDSYINLVIPRGGESLIRTVVEESTIPVIKHYKGVCKIYVDQNCDQTMALDIIENAKCQRPGVCNAVESVLLHKDIADTFASKLAERLSKVELRGDKAFCGLVPRAIEATEEDWSAEFLDYIIAVGVVPDLAAAIEHINRYGSHHSDSIVTSDSAAAGRFMREVDSAAVYHNVSTRFTDGYEFGMGAEIGISTDKLHARGPMGLQELTSYKFLVYGDGQLRK